MVIGAIQIGLSILEKSAHKSAHLTLTHRKKNMAPSCLISSIQASGGGVMV